MNGRIVTTRIVKYKLVEKYNWMELILIQRIA